MRTAHRQEFPFGLCFSLDRLSQSYFGCKEQKFSVNWCRDLTTKMSMLAWTSGMAVCVGSEPIVRLSSFTLFISWLRLTLSVILRQDPPQYLAEVDPSITFPSSSQLQISANREWTLLPFSVSITEEGWPCLDSLPQSQEQAVDSKQHLFGQGLFMCSPRKDESHQNHMKQGPQEKKRNEDFFVVVSRRRTKEHAKQIKFLGTSVY